ncbi:MAG: hypothetical protein LBQ39_04520, partial [Tannerellaceae bacterium]|nr:hypothetical protein [Tannerellaceae bacterium]
LCGYRKVPAWGRDVHNRMWSRRRNFRITKHLHRAKSRTGLEREACYPPTNDGCIVNLSF